MLNDDLEYCSKKLAFCADHKDGLLGPSVDDGVLVDQISHAERHLDGFLGPILRNIA